MKKLYIIHPILFAIFPILSLYDHNKEISDSSFLFWPIIISLFFTLIFFTAFKQFTKNSIKSGVCTSLFIILFFISGHFLNFMAPYIRLPFFYILLLLILIIYIGITALIISSKKNYKTFTKYLNLVGIILIILPLINIGVYEYRRKDASSGVANSGNKSAEHMPDIYYIILDGHARSDILKEIYNYNNDEFIQYLKDKGFYVAGKSTSNYPQTFLSMSSALNFEYINYLSETMGEESNDRRPLRKMLKENNVYYLLKNAGYKFVTLPATWTGVDNNLHSDIKIDNTSKIDTFDKMLLNITPLGLILNNKIGSMFFREKILFNLDNLPKIAEIDSPTFTYTHLLIPHPPFVFDANGDEYKEKAIMGGLDGDQYFKLNPDRNDYIEKYRNSVTFIDEKMKHTVDEIISRSKTPPIIIIQADHGPGLNVYWENPEKTNMAERMSILNAHYLPEEAKKNLYESITPVNSFRIILNYILGTNYELLEDKNYFATWSHPYKFIDVTDKLNN